MTSFGKMSSLEKKMPQYKTLKSIAHNFGHSFLGLENFGDGNYIMGRLIEQAEKCGETELSINIKLHRWEYSPLIADDIEDSLVHYCTWFPKLVVKSNSLMKYIDSAQMRIVIDLNRKKETSPGNFETYYELTVEIIDNRGKKYLAEFKDFW